MPDVSILIVCYRSRGCIRDCIASVIAHSVGFQYEILLLDNSADGTLELVRSEFPSVRIVDSPGNIGFAAGNNLLARNAIAPHLLLLNPDTLLRDNAIGALLDLARTLPDAGAWGGVPVLPDGRVDPGCTQAETGLRSALLYAMGLGGRLARGGNVLDGPVRVTTLSGAFMMARADLWHELGGFDESFFMYSEEAELCYRIRQAGWNIYRTPAARVTHFVGGSGTSSSTRINAMMRGRMHFMRKHRGVVNSALMGCITWAHGLSRYLCGWIGRPVLGRDRAKSIRDTWSPLLRHPAAWWFGYANRTPLPAPDSHSCEPTRSMA